MKFAITICHKIKFAIGIFIQTYHGLNHFTSSQHSYIFERCHENILHTR